MFNEECVTSELDDLIVVEGELDVLACYSNGIDNVVGVPGATNKKAAWIKKLDSSNIKIIYTLYDSDKVGQDAAKEMAIRIGLDKVKNILLPAFTFKSINGVEYTGKDINDWFKQDQDKDPLGGFLKLVEAAKPFDVEGIQSLIEIIDELEEDAKGNRMIPPLDSPWSSVNQLIGGCEYGDVIGITAPSKVGKAQPLWSKIKTFDGWKKMGDLQIGDKLASIDGLSSEVVGIFPQGKQETFKFTFSDGRETHVTGDHLWYVETKNHIKLKKFVVSTNQLIQLLKTKTNQKGLYIPLFSGNYGEKQTLPIDPWLLGLLLGDGNLCGNTLSIYKTDLEIETNVEKILIPLGCKTSRMSSGFRIITEDKNHKQTVLVKHIKDLGLYGTFSETKFIPDIYLEGTRVQRLELLQGLMDTDGTTEKRGATYLSTSSLKLALQTQYLVRSLGGISNIKVKKPFFTYKGVKKEGLLNYLVTIKIKNREQVFTLKRKKNRASTVATKKINRLTIKKIESVGIENTQCIKVSHPSQLYITDDFIVTHNSTLCLNWLDYYVRKKDIQSLFFCLEMPRKRLVRKWISYSTETVDQPGNYMSLEAIQKGRFIIQQMTSDLLFGFTRFKKAEEVFETIYQAKRRYGIKILCFDNLHMLTRDKNHRTEEIDNLSKNFKQLAMELNLLILLILQPTKSKEGQIVDIYDSRGAAALVQDLDVGLALHRNKKAKMTETQYAGMGQFLIEDAYEPQTLLDFGATRYAPGGKCTLFFKGNISKFIEFSEIDQKAKEDLTLSSPIISVESEY